MNPIQIALKIGDEKITIKGQLWKAQGSPTIPKARIVMVHGTLDNSGSWTPLCQFLSSSKYNYECVAMDLSGHGQSDWRPGGFYHPSSWVTEIVQFIKALGDDYDRNKNNNIPVIACGHSLGQALVTLTAGSFPELFDHVILVEGMGWWSKRTPSEMKEMSSGVGFAGRPSTPIGEDYYLATKTMRRHVKTILDIDQRNKNKPTKIYPSMEEAIDAREKSALIAPNDQSISRFGAECIVKRGSKLLYDDHGMTVGVQYIHDNRINGGVGNVVMEDADVLIFLDNLPGNILLIHGDKSGKKTWPGIVQRSLKRLPKIKDINKWTTYFLKDQSHHPHTDVPESIAEKIQLWFDMMYPADNNNKSDKKKSKL